MTTTKTDIYGIIEEPEDIYHARSKSGEYMSSHMLQLYARSPYKYWMKVNGFTTEQPNAAYDFGRAAHCYILEGQNAFNSAYVVSDGPVNEKTGLPYGKATKAYQDWLSMQEGEIVTTDDFHTICNMRDSITKHYGCCDLLDAARINEGVVLEEINGVKCQIRMDSFSPEYGIIDLKTCRDIEFFEKDISDYGYCYQLAFYRMVLEKHTGVRFPVHIIAVDKTEFNIAGRWDIPDSVIDKYEKINLASLNRYAKSMESGEWQTGFEVTRVYAEV